MDNETLKRAVQASRRRAGNKHEVAAKAKPPISEAWQGLISRNQATRERVKRLEALAKANIPDTQRAVIRLPIKENGRVVVAEIGETYTSAIHDYRFPNRTHEFLNFFLLADEGTHRAFRKSKPENRFEGRETIGQETNHYANAGFDDGRGELDDLAERYSGGSRTPWKGLVGAMRRRQATARVAVFENSLHMIERAAANPDLNPEIAQALAELDQIPQAA